MSAHSSGLLPPDELADLHIFVVPLESWLEKYRTAFNNIALESVSAGFVRVLPYISLYVLRDHIEEQLGPDVVPEDYVFLRSVGRCMAVVKENQERLLKAKDFLPPKAYSPEVFILPLTHDAVARPVADANTIIATHGITTAGMASTQPVHLGMIPAGYQQNPHLGSQMVNNGYLLPQSGQTDDTGVMDRDDYTDNRHQRNNRLNELQFGNEQPASDDSGSSDERKQRINGRRKSEDDGSGGSSENERLAERSYQKKKVSKGGHNENEEKDQFEPSVSHNNEDYTIENPPSKTKKHKMQKRASSDSSGSNQSGPKTVKFIQPEVHHSLAVPGPGGQLISPPTPIPSGRVISSPMPVQQHPNLEPGSDAKSDNRKSEGQNEKGAVIEKDLVNDKQKKVEQKGGKKKRKGRSRSPLGDQVQAKAKEQSTEMEAVKEKDRLDKLAVHSEVSMGRSASPPSLSEVEERSKFSQFPSPAKGARRPAPLSDMYDLQHGQGTEQEFSESHHDYNSHGLEDNPNSNLQGAADGETFESPFVNGHDNQGEFDGDEQSSRDNLQGQDGHLETTGKDDGKTGGVGTGGKDSIKHGKGSKGNPVKVKRTVKKTVKKTPPENLDEKFKIPKVSPPPLMKEPQRGDKELEKDTPSAKDRKHQEIEELKAGLRRAKNDRVDMEKERESKMRRAKMLQNQVLQKRNQAKNVWKKRFFDEKRKTAPLEEQVNRLRYEVDVQHKALMSYLESKEREGNKTQAGAEFKSPSEKTNQRMSLARLQHEVEELKSRIEELKMKLTAEMKKRDAAQKELKQIREDLMEQKINLTLTKSQKSLATLTNPENIAV